LDIKRVLKISAALIQVLHPWSPDHCPTLTKDNENQCSFLCPPREG
jgi:hypothetical protein